jgi:uncharacterized phage protein (TIGR02216 family)
MAVGFGVLGLPPTTFWAMTPKELEAALRGKFGGASEGPPGRGDVASLMRKFPDAPGSLSPCGEG